MIDIDKLTIGDLKEIANLTAQLGLLSSAPASAVALEALAPAPHPFVGKYVICRCSAAGVHAGTLVSADDDKVVLNDARRLWYWKARKGIALSGVAQHGLASGCKIDATNPSIYLTGVCEIIPCSPEARESVNAYPN